MKGEYKMKRIIAKGVKLTPEQVSGMRKTIVDIQKRMPGYYDYLNERSIAAIDETNGRFADQITDFSYAKDKDRLEQYRSILRTARFVQHPNTATIDIGTRFVIKFDDEDEIENLMLVEDTIGLDSINGSITLASPIGMSLFGKKEGEAFSYQLARDGRLISLSGEIVEIKKQPSDYIKFIRSRKKSNRRSGIQCVVPFQLTISQVQLLNEELVRLESNRMFIKTSKEREIISNRLHVISHLLRTIPVVEPPKDNTIGIGSRFDIMYINEAGENETRHVEMINEAVSSEVEGDYVEAISPIGVRLLGLQANSHFEYLNSNRGGKIAGIVYNIDNSNTNELPKVNQKK